MTTLFRYLAKEILKGTALLLLALLALFALFDLMAQLGELGKGNYGLTKLLAYVTLLQPNNLVVIFPLAALMGTLLAISRLSAQSELTVMRASGLSLKRLAVYAAIIGLMFSGLIFLFGEFVAPASEDAARHLKLSATSNMVAQKFRSGFWVKDENSFVNIQTVTPETQLLDMRIYDFDANHRLTSISIVKKATYEANNRWLLEDVEKTMFDGVPAGGQTARIERQPKATWNSAMAPDLMSVLRVSPDSMSMTNLSAYIDHLRDNKQNSTRYEWAFWAKLFQPAAVIIMMLLAIPFAIQSTRVGGVGAKLLLGVMIGVGFHFLNQLTSHLTVLYSWPPLLSASMPVMIFLVVALFLIGWKENTSWFLKPVAK
jgi:lipopolysaccharide export system permease protein